MTRSLFGALLALAILAQASDASPVTTETGGSAVVASTPPPVMHSYEVLFRFPGLSYVPCLQLTSAQSSFNRTICNSFSISGPAGSYQNGIKTKWDCSNGYGTGNSQNDIPCDETIYIRPVNSGGSVYGHRLSIRLNSSQAGSMPAMEDIYITYSGSSAYVDNDCLPDAPYVTFYAPNGWERCGGGHTEW